RRGEAVLLREAGLRGSGGFPSPQRKTMGEAGSAWREGIGDPSVARGRRTPARRGGESDRWQSAVLHADGRFRGRLRLDAGERRRVLGRSLGYGLRTDRGVERSVRKQDRPCAI